MLDQDVGRASWVIVRNLPGEHLEQDAAERVLIGALIHRPIVGLLRRHVVRSPEHRAGLGVALPQIESRRLVRRALR